MRSTPRTTRELLKISTEYLTARHIESPRLTAEVLLAHHLGTDRVRLYLNLDQPLNETEVSGYRELIRRRVRHEPLQYITGRQEFWSLGFKVDARVLIPRPETELLVEQALSRVRGLPGRESAPTRILDLGTGSGVLAVTLAREIPGAQVVAVDISSEALALARKNAEAHGVLDRIHFLEGDLFQPLTGKGLLFDFVVANPPYVGTGELGSLAPEVRDFEPRIALDGGPDGTAYLRKIIEQCPAFMGRGAWLILEMAPAQVQPVAELMQRMQAYGDIATVKDYSNRYRVICAMNGKESS